MSTTLQYQTALKFRTIWRCRLSLLERSVCEMSPSNRELTDVKQSEKETSIQMSQDELLQKIRERMPSKIGTQMLDEGILDSLRQSRREDIPPLIHGFMSRYSRPRDLHEVKTCVSLISKLKGILPKSCEKCLFLKSRCVCPHIRMAKAKHKLWVFQSPGDYGRKNNSATLLCLVTGARRTLRGFQDQEDELLCHISKHKKSTIVVFPSEFSMEVDDLAKQIETNGKDQPQTLILLDGTWGDAANMDKFLPSDIARVKLSSEHRLTWLYPMRGQSRFDRVCTAQGKQLYSNRIRTNCSAKFIVDAAISDCTSEPNLYRISFFEKN